MPLLNLNNNQAEQPQQQQSGLLDSGMMPMMMLAMLNRKRRGGGNSNAINALMQMEIHDRNFSRQQQQDALEMKKFELMEQKYNRELSEYNAQIKARDELIGSLGGGSPQPTSNNGANAFSQSESQPQGIASQPDNTTSSPSTKQRQAELLIRMGKVDDALKLVNEDKTKLPTGYMPVNPQDLSQGITPIPGGGEDKMTPEQAGKTQMLRSAQNKFPEIDKLFYDSDGSVNNLNVFNAQKFFGVEGTPGSDGRALRSFMEQGIQAITRQETGAAMPESEVENTRTRFMPKPFDSGDLKKAKIEMFKDFINGTLKLIDPSGRFDNKRFETELQARVNNQSGSSGTSSNSANNPAVRRYNLEKGAFE